MDEGIQERPKSTSRKTDRRRAGGVVITGLSNGKEW